MTIQKNLILRSLEATFHIFVKTIEQLNLGADVNASVYKVVSTNGNSYFVKFRSNPGQNPGLEVLKFLENAGVPSVIYPVVSAKGKIIQTIEASAFIVFPFINGSDGFSRNLNDQQWIKLGETISKIHGLVLPKNPDLSIRQETFTPDSVNGVLELLSRLSHVNPKDRIGISFARLLRTKQSLIEKMTNQAELLSKKLRKRRHKMVLCHGDLHGGNVMLSEKDEIFLVDWDDPVIAPVERDLMFIGGGIGNIWNTERELSLFYQGYGQKTPDQVLMTYYRMERILQDVVEYGEELLFKKGSPGDRVQLYEQFSDQFNENGVFEIAIATGQKLSLTEAPSSATNAHED